MPMKLLSRCDSAIEAWHLAGVLKAGGVRCEVRNTQLSGALGEIPWDECAPQLWLVDAADEPLARRLIDMARSAPLGPAWRCNGCGESIEPQFSDCWRCGAERPV
jgi:Putative prokaryotic signal transducing protein